MSGRPADRLLARLGAARETAPGRWIARCPAHTDRGPSLSIRELDDGRLLIHDFGGCAAADVLDAVGLSLSDLFADGGREPRPGQRRRPRVPAGDCLLLAAREVLTAAVLAADFIDGRAIDEPSWRRLAACAARLGRLADEVGPRAPRPNRELPRWPTDWTARRRRAMRGRSRSTWPRWRARSRSRRR